ncbi:hypothetical protein HMPREF0201_01431 [Cedecea davisae DSM 4568]|uniref:Uncharacterized protein n=1 Tax=Cedecea davisae DSM 4568 TaxID=566551 RepID=S3JCY1_9ENTR|nr:hypothetical protein HMPREF0201_01431 [Cedecea davisae DSM 4568]
MFEGSEFNFGAILTLATAEGLIKIKAGDRHLAGKSRQPEIVLLIISWRKHYPAY